VKFFIVMRKARFGGYFYPEDQEELEGVVRGFIFKSTKNNTKNIEDIQAGIAPHAGYIFSGKLAGEVIGRLGRKKNIILLGVNHSGIGSKISFSQQDFETPLGIVRNNKELSLKIIEKIKKEKLDVSIDEESHENEHSIEVQLPFLQKSQKDFEIVPLLLKDLTYEECKKIAEILSSFITENIAVLVSSDFTHYGENYGFVPFTENIKGNLYELDKKIISEIVRLNSRLVFEKASNTTICGLYGITIITEIAKIKKLKAKLVDYYTSGDISRDWNNCVGYAGIVFY
jgi:MEMO1 family protein